MDKINLPVVESIKRFEEAVYILQSEYSFLQRYLTSDEQQEFVDSWVKIEELINTLKDKM